MDRSYRLILLLVFESAHFPRHVAAASIDTCKIFHASSITASRSGVLARLILKTWRLLADQKAGVTRFCRHDASASCRRFAAESATSAFLSAEIGGSLQGIIRNAFRPQEVSSLPERNAAG